MVLERLTFQFENLEKVANDQKLTIEKLTNNEAWTFIFTPLGIISLELSF